MRVVRRRRPSSVVRRPPSVDRPSSSSVVVVVRRRRPSNIICLFVEVVRTDSLNLQTFGRTRLRGALPQDKVRTPY